ncbi:MAG TPA: hypothetical protein VNA57_07565 [Acidimicrobiales bacterium]|nr:hypothetical protein [Acidimicrobiales bacterium]
MVVGDASTSMGYCSAVPGATAKRIGGTVTVTVVATTGTCANGASLTPGRAYTVYYRDGSVWRDPNGPDPWSRNNGTCMTGTSRVAIGSGTANAGGGWTTATYNLPSSGVTLNASNTDASVCVESDGAFNEGNEAPVQIVSV